MKERLRDLLRGSWVAAVRARLRGVKWEVLVKDVGPFLESAEDRALLTRETITRLLDQHDRPLPPPPVRPRNPGRRPK